MDRVEQMMQMSETDSEDLLLREFVNKRAVMQNETLRTLASQCISLCSMYAQKNVTPPNSE